MTDALSCYRSSQRAAKHELGFREDISFQQRNRTTSVNADLFLHNSAGIKMHNCAEEKCTILPANNAQSYRYKLHKNQPLLI